MKLNIKEISPNDFFLCYMFCNDILNNITEEMFLSFADKCFYGYLYEIECLYYQSGDLFFVVCEDFDIKFYNRGDRQLPINNIGKIINKLIKYSKI